MTSSIAHDKSLNYEIKVSSAPRYQVRKIPQTSGGTVVPITQSSSVQTFFDLPSGTAYNLSKSYLKFDMYLTANGANATAAGAHLSFPPIRRMLLQTRANKPLVDISNFQYFWKMCKNLIRKCDDEQALSASGFDNTLALAYQDGINYYGQPGNTLPATPPSAIANHCTKITSAATPAVDNGTTDRRAYLSEIPYCTAALGNIGGGGGNLAIASQIMLGHIPFSLFNVDRDIWTAEALQLMVEWEAYDNFLFQHTAVATLAGPATLDITAALPTVSNYSLYVAMEMNDIVNAELRAKVLSSGLQMVVPYSNIFNFVLGTNTNASWQQRLTIAHGKRLLRILSAEALTTSTLTSRCNFYNWSAALTQVFNTQTNNQRNEPEDLTVANNDDFRYMFPKLKGCPLEVLQEYYTDCPSYCTDWSAAQSLTEAPEKDLQICGVPLDVELLYSKNIITKSATATTSWVVAVTQKDFISTAVGVDIQ